MSPLCFLLGNESLKAIRKEINPKKLNTLGDNCIKLGKSCVLNNKLLKNMFIIRSKMHLDVDDDAKMDVCNQIIKKTMNARIGVEKTLCRPKKLNKGGRMMA